VKSLDVTSSPNLAKYKSPSPKPGRGILYERTYTGKKKRNYGNKIDWKQKYHSAWEKIQDLTFVMYYGAPEPEVVAADPTGAAARQAREALEAKSKAEKERDQALMRLESALKEAAEARASQADAQLAAKQARQEAKQHLDTLEALKTAVGVMKDELQQRASTIDKRDITIEALKTMVTSKTNELDMLRVNASQNASKPLPPPTSANKRRSTGVYSARRPSTGSSARTPRSTRKKNPDSVNSTKKLGNRRASTTSLASRSGTLPMRDRSSTRRQSKDSGGPRTFSHTRSGRTLLGKVSARVDTGLHRARSIRSRRSPSTKPDMRF
jgi:hypothetical protein